MQAIGIDIGTTSICGVVLDTVTGQVLRSRTENSEAFIDTGTEWEKIQSPGKIIALATEILEDLLTPDTAVIGVTGQMHGILYTDGSGQAVSPLYTWQDGRGNQPYGDTTYAAFLNSHSGYGTVTDLYNRVNGLVPDEAVQYCTIHDYFVMTLCGRTRALLHASDAASLGGYDLKRNCFTCDNGLEVVSDYCIAGAYRGIPVSVAIGDNQASVFSSLSSAGDILVNVGTGSQVSIVSDTPVFGENIETRPYFDGQYLIVGSALCGGRAYAILKNFYAQVLACAGVEGVNVYRLMDGMLADCGESELQVDTRFSGTRGDERLRGSIKGISTENFTPQQLTGGVLTGMMAELRDMYAAMGVTRSGLVGSGNGIRLNPRLAREAEKAFGLTLKIPAHREEAAFGAAMFGMVSAGICSHADEARRMIAFTTAH